MVVLSSQAAHWLDNAADFRKKNQYHLALECYWNALDKDEKNKAIWKSIADLSIDLEKYREALECIDNALSLVRKTDLAYAVLSYSKAWVLDLLGDHDKAIEQYEQTREVAEGLLKHAKDAKEEKKVKKVFEAAYNDEAYVLTNFKPSQNMKARQLIEEALKDDKENPAYLDTKAVILYNDCKYKCALQLLDEAIKIIEKKGEAIKIKEKKGESSKYSDAEFYFHRGNVLYKLKKWDQAVRSYDDAIGILESQAHKDGNTLRAEHSISHLLAIVHHAKAASLSQKNDSNGALQELRQAVKKDPTLASAQQDLTKLINTTGVRGDFWQFWTSSFWKKIILAAILIVLVAVIFQPILANLLTGNLTTQTQMKQIIAQSNVTITTTQDYSISQSELIAVGLAILVLLSPEISKATIGPVTL
ncbi:MAG TPA: tetratricopeptide repeat protein, partial [Candidatus Bathyarchaeia archaeon]|nr:tetratricopeptide repeat protein [Candidatus Bathyarchaeia archaeon]